MATKSMNPLSPRWCPRLVTFEIRLVDSHAEVNAEIAAVNRQPVLFRYTVGLLDGYMDCNPAVIIELESRILSDAVLLAIVGDKKARSRYQKA